MKTTKEIWWSIFTKFAHKQERYEDARKSYEKVQDSERNYKKTEQVNQTKNKINIEGMRKLVRLEKSWWKASKQNLKNLEHPKELTKQKEKQ